MGGPKLHSLILPIQEIAQRAKGGKTQEAVESWTETPNTSISESIYPTPP